MTAAEQKFYELTEQHARQLGFRLCEFFESSEEPLYYLCFRPVPENPGDSDVYAWKYVELDTNEVHKIAHLGVLPAEFTDLLNDAFANMRHYPHA